jgi:hypothetical protein
MCDYDAEEDRGKERQKKRVQCKRKRLLRAKLGISSSDIKLPRR